MKKYHYYPNSSPDTDNMTACGRDGRKVGGLISFFFRGIKRNIRCKTCDKQFKKEEVERG